jgi:hypothetical protein
MRLRLTVALVTIAVTAAAGCARESGATAGGGRDIPAVNPASSSGTAEATRVAPSGKADDRAQACDRFGAWLAHYPGDKSQPTVRDYDQMRHNPTQYSTQQKIAIRQAHFAYLEQTVRSLAAAAPDNPLRSALNTFADDLAERARDSSSAGPARALPDGGEIVKLCGASTGVEIDTTRR